MHLWDLRVDMKGGFDAAHSDTGDLRRDVSEGFIRTVAALTTISQRLDEVDQGVRLADRLTAIEKRLADLEARRGS